MHLKVRTRLNGSVCAYWNIFLSNHIHIPDRALKGVGHCTVPYTLSYPLDFSHDITRSQPLFSGMYGSI